MSNLNNVFARQPKAAQAPASAHASRHGCPVTYGQILVEQVRGSYDAQVRTSSVILITISLLSIFFCFIILSGACLPAARAQVRAAVDYRVPESAIKLARTTFYVVLACFVVDLAALIAFIVWLFG